jgi:hypothetical protein
MLGSNCRRLLDPKHEKQAKVGRMSEGGECNGLQCAIKRAINVLCLSPGGIPRGSVYRRD